MTNFLIGFPDMTQSMTLFPQTSFEAKNGLKDIFLAGEVIFLPWSHKCSSSSNPSFHGKEGEGKLISRENYPSQGRNSANLPLEGQFRPQKMFGGGGNWKVKVSCAAGGSPLFSSHTVLCVNSLCLNCEAITCLCPMVSEFYRFRPIFGNFFAKCFADSSPLVADLGQGNSGILPL